MQKIQIKHKKTVAGAVVAALALAGLGAGVANADIPDGGGVIHGCYHPQSDGHSSALGVIDTALSNGHCPSGQTEVTWNQTGPQGPPGATGATGATGTTGRAGASGISNYQLIQQSQAIPGCGGIFFLSIPSGDQVLGAGVDNGSVFIKATNGPDPSDSTKWEFTISNGSTTGGCGFGTTLNLWMTVATVSS